MRKAAIHLDIMELEGEEEDGHQGPKHKGVQQVHDHPAHPHQEDGDQEVDGHQGAKIKGVRQFKANPNQQHQLFCDQEACHIPKQKLSFRMMKNHPDRKQEWKGGFDGQAVHGQEELQVQGVHHHVQEEEQGAVEKGAMGSPGSLPPLPSSPSTSGGSSPSTPRAKKTPGSRPPRVVVTPLWKRKSIARKSSSFRSSRAAILRMSQVSSQDDPPSQAVELPKPADTITYKSMVSHTTKKARSGSTDSNNVSILTKPYHPKQSASITDRPADKGRELRPIMKQEKVHGKD